MPLLIKWYPYPNVGVLNGIKTKLTTGETVGVMDFMRVTGAAGEAAQIRLIRDTLDNKEWYNEGIVTQKKDASGLVLLYGLLMQSKKRGTMKIIYCLEDEVNAVIQQEFKDAKR